MRKICLTAMSAIMGASMILGGCGSSSNKSETSQAEATKTSDAQAQSEESAENKKSEEIEKPEKITIMVDGTMPLEINGRDAFQKKWEEMTGIKLEIIQPDHSAYYDVLGQTFASGPENWPDVILLSSSYYTGYAQEGALWDMTDAWENSDLNKSGRYKDPSIMDNLRINGKVYGFADSRGNGCITYVKKKWLDNCGLSAPTTYDEYLNMLDAFTKGDPDGNGVNGDTYGTSAPGVIGSEAPFTNYLPEIYQDATISFKKDADGKWVDGFTQPDMKDALERLQYVNQQGYLDKEALTNTTQDCRNKFYEDKYGVFSYWAGTWNSNLKMSLEANGLDGELIALPPIKELGAYKERNSTVWAITEACENPEGVFHYFLENMLDGGEMQTLWTYGVEDVHWSKKAETVCGNTYPEGEFHFREVMNTPGTQFTKFRLDPMTSLGTWVTEDIGADAIKPEAKAAQQTFNENCEQIPLMPSTDVLTQYNGDLMTLKRSIVADVVLHGMSYEEGMKRFEDEGGAEWSKLIVESFNNQ